MLKMLASGPVFAAWKILSRSRWRLRRTTPGLGQQLLSSYVRDPDAVFLAERERHFGSESWPGGQDGEVFSQRRQNPGFRQVQTVLNKIDTSTLEVVQRIAGHADSRTTKLYD